MSVKAVMSFLAVVVSLNCIASEQVKNGDSVRTADQRPAPVRPAPPAARPSLPSEIFGKDIIGTAPRLELPALRNDQIRDFLSRHQSEQERKNYIGLNRDISINTVRDGRWTSPKKNLQVWAVSLVAHEAKGIRVHFNRFDLPIGARLFVYGPGQEESAQALSGKGPYASGEFWSKVILGEEVRFEYMAPDGTKLSPDRTLFEVSQISHLFADPLGTVSEWQVAGSCNLDASCYPAWKTQEESVGRVLGNDSEGEFGCSGVLLNNQANDGAPFFLTANHCFSTDAVAQTADVFWDYATTTCAQTTTPDPASSPQTYGSSLLTTTFSDDSTLLLLNGPPASDATFSGWSTTYPSVGNDLTAVHHPSASWRRISFGRTGSGKLASYPDFIEVFWNAGVLEPGSSGGPGYNDSHQVVGIVSRGSSSCSYPSSPDYFAPFSNAYPSLNATGVHDYLVKGGPDDQYAPNQSRTTAASLPLPFPQAFLILKSSAANDWFKVHVAAATQMEVDISAPGGPPSFEYYVGNSTTPVSPGTPPFVYFNANSDADIYLHVSLPAGQEYMRYSLATSITQYQGLLIKYTNGDASDPYTLWFDMEEVQLEGLSALSWFEYSTDPSMTNVQRTPALPLNGGSQTSRADAVPNTTYYWRAVVQDAINTVYTNVGKLTTGSPLPGASWNMPILGFQDTPPGTPVTNPNVFLTPNWDSNVRLYEVSFSITPPFSMDNPPGSNPCYLGIYCQLIVSFNPTQPGTYTGTLTATIHGASYTLPLQGTATTTTANGSFDQRYLQFYIFDMGGQQTRMATLTNTGTGPLWIYYVTYQATGSSINHFSQTNDCGSSLAPGSSCHFYITFTPTHYGSDGNQLQVSTSAAISPTLMLYGDTNTVTITPQRPSRPVRSSTPSTLSSKRIRLTPKMWQLPCDVFDDSQCQERLR